MAVVGVEAVAAPRVVPQHDVGAEPADPVGHLPALADPRRQLTVGPARGTRPRPRPPTALAAARCSSRRVTTSWAGSCRGSQVPFEPSVQTRWLTSVPAAAHLASVAPQPNSMSSGWAPMASARCRCRQVPPAAVRRGAVIDRCRAHAADSRSASPAAGRGPWCRSRLGRGGLQRRRGPRDPRPRRRPSRGHGPARPAPGACGGGPRAHGAGTTPPRRRTRSRSPVGTHRTFVPSSRRSGTIVTPLKAGHPAERRGERQIGVGHDHPGVARVARARRPPPARPG